MVAVKVATLIVQRIRILFFFNCYSFQEFVMHLLQNDVQYMQSDDWPIFIQQRASK